MYPVFQISTLLFLISAANASYLNFPNLASILARDNFLPHQFAFRGDRLAFSIGILFLAIIASCLLIGFNGDTSKLLNVYVLGVFITFTLSLVGMLRYWWRLRRERKRWQLNLIINGLGALTTLIIALVIALTKFFESTWIVVVTIPLLVCIFLVISRHYLRVERERTTDIPAHPKDVLHRFIVPFTKLDEASIQCLAYAFSVSADVSAVYITSNAHEASAMREEWKQLQQEDEELPRLVVIESSRRTSRSLLSYIDAVHELNHSSTITVILPMLVGISWWKFLLYNRSTIKLRMSLQFHPGIIISLMQIPFRPFNSRQGKRTIIRNVPLHPQEIGHRLLVPIARLDRVSIQSLAYARSISPFVTAIHIAIDMKDHDVMRTNWQHYQKSLMTDEEFDLVVIESPYRSLAYPLLAYIHTMYELYPEDTLTLILPGYVVYHWWEEILHNQTLLQLQINLLSYPNVVITNVLQHIEVRPPTFICRKCPPPHPHRRPRLGNETPLCPIQPEQHGKMEREDI